MVRRGLLLVVLVACSSEESSSSSGGGDAGGDVAATDAGDSGPIIPASDGGCDSSVPGMSAGSEAQCAGKQGQIAPGATGAEPGAACTTAEDCRAFCCTCTGGDAGASFNSSVSVCGCGNVCASAQETCAFYEKTFQLCN